MFIRCMGKYVSNIPNAIAVKADIEFSRVVRFILKIPRTNARYIDTKDIMTPLSSRVYLNFCSI